MKQHIFFISLILTLAGLVTTANAAEYKIDTKGAHAFIQFKIKHLGFSWLLGRFNTFDGSFTYDEKNPNAAKVNVTIKTLSSSHTRPCPAFDRVQRARFQR